MERKNIASELATVRTWEEAPTHNEGIVQEWALCLAYGITRKTHDRIAYDKGSDIELASANISVKGEKFSLMSGTLCKGETTFDGIWNVFETNVHSNVFAYVTKAGMVYLMTLAEFQKFVYLFGSLTKESAKNGGYTKIRMRSETKAVLDWLEAHIG